jgi:maltooligosyltrehalose synthase
MNKLAFKAVVGRVRLCNLRHQAEVNSLKNCVETLSQGNHALQSEVAALLMYIAKLVAGRASYLQYWQYLQQASVTPAATKEGKEKAQEEMEMTLHEVFT